MVREVALEKKKTRCDKVSSNQMGQHLPRVSSWTGSGGSRPTGRTVCPLLRSSFEPTVLATVRDYSPRRERWLRENIREPWNSLFLVTDRTVQERGGEIVKGRENRGWCYLLPRVYNGCPERVAEGKRDCLVTFVHSSSKAAANTVTQGAPSCLITNGS